nr:MAG TPA: hypothetical protein [Caudoviricetes sp.]
MFPVTLEDTEGNVLTVYPPCYGFLQLRNYNGGADEGDDGKYDEYFEPNTYEATRGWNMHVKVWSEASNIRSADGQDCLLSDEMDMCDIKHIWNSGTHLDMLGFLSYRDKKPVTKGLGWGNIDQEGELKNNIERWNDKNPEYQTTPRAVLEAMEAFVDKDRPSCLRWHEKGFMGVATENVHADRCLFYLMLDRTFYCEDEESQVETFLHKWLVEGWTILQAYVYSRMVSTYTNLLGETKTTLVGNDWDACIFPASLFTVGMADKYTEAFKVPWRQQSYNHGCGHFRDEDFKWISYENNETSDLRVNNSMFLPVMHPDLVKSGSETLECDNLLVNFVRRVSKGERTADKLLYGNRIETKDMFNIYNIIQRFSSGTLDQSSEYSVVPSSEWDGIMSGLFLGK